jgi:hypothetical protein
MEFVSFFDLPLRTFCLKTSLFQQIDPPKFCSSASLTHKLTFKTTDRRTVLLTTTLKIKIAYISQFETNSIGVYNQFIGWLEMKFEINRHHKIIVNQIRWLVQLAKNQTLDPEAASSIPRSPWPKKPFFTSYMEYIESIGFTPKILKFFFCSNHVFYR